MSFYNAYAQYKKVPVYFNGHIETDRDSVLLKVVLTKNFITGQGEGENIFINVPVNTDGSFQLLLPTIHHVGRLILYDGFTNNSLFVYQLVEPGDSIFIDAKIHDQTDPTYFTANFNGRGVGKYTCSEKLKGIKNTPIHREKNGQRIMLVSDSILEKKLEILDEFKNQLSLTAYQIIKADIIGDVYNSSLSSICGDQFSGVLSGTLTAAEMKEKKQLFDAFIANSSTKGVPEKMLSLSGNYTEFLVKKAQINLAFQHVGNNFGIKELYTYLRNNYTGEIREKLLVYCLMARDVYEDMAADEFTALLDDAVKLVKAEWLKEPVLKLRNARGKGAVAFDFTLPADSSNNQVKLSDLRGKVLLVDAWAYQCTACNFFARIFHERIYSQLRNNPDFKVVSIMLDPSNKEGYMRRLRNEGGTTYTYPDYINLFGGKGVEVGRNMASHYAINSWPFVFLIDKKGRIYSSTIPFFTEPNSPNIEKLLTLIKQALSES
jgi:thiol-disulfide isomerase/thioredoxin